ncbi:hypothetical protein [Phaeospirillum tilakii]|uniref:Lipoprotein n=1 Tax=Phaeospirillum tilakii TaxID=741673 RepID=A0ABW5C8D4_9PROT
MSSRSLPRRLHPIAGGLALGLIALFLTATVLVELAGDAPAIATVKSAILWAIPLLVVAMATAGATGRALARPNPAASAAKLARMKLIGANGLLVLIPAAWFLAGKAQAGQFDTAFALVQTLELATGGINLLLLSRNLRAGLIRSESRA